MKRTSIALAVMAGTLAAIKPCSIAEIPLLYVPEIATRLAAGRLALQRRVEPPRNAGEHEMADIIDTAAEIEELQRNAALSAHRLNRNAASLSVVKNATNHSRATARCSPRLPNVRGVPWCYRVKE